MIVVLSVLIICVTVLCVTYMSCCAGREGGLFGYFRYENRITKLEKTVEELKKRL